jgi:hypothetical protein
MRTSAQVDFALNDVFMDVRIHTKNNPYAAPTVQNCFTYAFGNYPKFNYQNLPSALSAQSKLCADCSKRSAP